MGGHGSATWYKGAKFTGMDDGGAGCCVFSLKPRCALYPASGFNGNFQYLASGCTSGINPNGVGMGGQVKNFALFIDSSLDFGHR